ncbi:MAG: hypothetical protein LUG18_00090 [Candidatus Azobacteroides sp.]|nr:hypothetical protein [Candidatus Azobacteroides sp.]
MVLKDLINEVQEDIQDVKNTQFIYSNTTSVPRRKDLGLTFESGKEKKGKILNTCVLYVDIRDSVILTHKYDSETMGKLYTAFTKAVLKIAKYYSGHIRNIIGDRVMVIFKPENCFSNAIYCAIAINHVFSKVFPTIFKGIDFKCGIGIDYGELKVIKVGIQRRNEEHFENLSLVWTGEPANIASRLTDFANKKIKRNLFDVIMKSRVINLLDLKRSSFNNIFGSHANSYNNTRYRETKETLNEEEFINLITHFDNSTTITTNIGIMSQFRKRYDNINYPPILITHNVFMGYKERNPECLTIKNSLWLRQEHNFNNVKCEVYRGDIILIFE